MGLKSHAGKYFLAIAATGSPCQNRGSPALEDATDMKNTKIEMPRHKVTAMLRREADRQASAHALRGQMQNADKQLEVRNPNLGLLKDTQARSRAVQIDSTTQGAPDLDDETMARLDFLSCLYANAPLAD